MVKPWLIVNYVAKGGNAGDMEYNGGSGNSNWGNEGGDTSTNQDNNNKNNNLLARNRR